MLKIILRALRFLRLTCINNIFAANNAKYANNYPVKNLALPYIEWVNIQLLATEVTENTENTEVLVL